jgi:hypothetical protein
MKVIIGDPADSKRRIKEYLDEKSNSSKSTNYFN